MTANDVIKWIKENAYKFAPFEVAKSNGDMLVLSEGKIRELEKLIERPT